MTTSQNLLAGITSPEDVKRLTDAELAQLADELRTFIIESVSRTGGHLASNLGTVELTLALLRVFDVPHDKIVWDVGHQAYSYKILTGRREAFDTLRRWGGLAGFPKRSESPYDCFNTGHSSTSLSAALGLSRALIQRGDDGHVIAVVGDGAMTGGMVYEALNNLTEDDRLIIILNDNEMSIAKNVGGLSRHLKHLRVSASYLKFKKSTREKLERIPAIGRQLASGLETVKNGVRRLVIGREHTVFDAFAGKYYGPIDGHDTELLTEYLEGAKKITGPVIIHISTIKGRGYRQAEEAPEDYHGVAPFVVEKGLEISDQSNEDRPFPERLPYVGSFTRAFSESLMHLAEDDPHVVALCAAMVGGTGLKPFAEAWPDRFFDVGIAEQHAVTMAAGMAAGGLKPVVAIYSTFLQRALDQVLHDVCLQALPVVFCIDRSGVVGEDGETHQGIYELGYLMNLPNLEILSPKDYVDLYLMLRYALKAATGPVAIRYARGGSVMPVHPLDTEALTDAEKALVTAEDPFAPEILRSGTRDLIVTWGNSCGRVLKAVETLRKDVPHFDPEIWDLKRLKPLPEAAIAERLRQGGHSHLWIFEEVAHGAGVAERLAAALGERHICVTVHRHDLGEAPVLHGRAADVLDAHEMAGEGLVRYMRRTWEETTT